ncbi:MAG: response regulator [Lachnospiraceae bacterium]|jgi:putative two-component system response regulator|nr:response regulator [Lachnospiraceae bacterium]
MDKTNHLKVLIVDDMEINVDILANIIEALGYSPLRSQSVEEALTIIKGVLPQLILFDVSMPGKDGYELITLLKKNPVTREIPVIFISAMDSMKDKIKGLELGAADFITKPFEATEVTMRVKNHMENYRMKQELETFNHRLHRMLTQQTTKIENEKKEILCSLARLVAEKCGTREGHLEKVAANSRLLAQGLKLLALHEAEITEDFIDSIEVASKLHDIGRLWECQEPPLPHTEAGVRILEELLHNEQKNEFREIALAIIRFHHTDWASPAGDHSLRVNEAIPLAARIVRIANDFDRFINATPKGQADESLQKIRDGIGREYDPELASVFIRIERQLYR